MLARQGDNDKCQERRVPFLATLKFILMVQSSGLLCWKKMGRREWGMTGLLKREQVPVNWQPHQLPGQEAIKGTDQKGSHGHSALLHLQIVQIHTYCKEETRKMENIVLLYHGTPRLHGSLIHGEDFKLNPAPWLPWHYRVHLQCKGNSNQYSSPLQRLRETKIWIGPFPCTLTAVQSTATLLWEYSGHQSTVIWRDLLTGCFFPCCN